MIMFMKIIPAHFLPKKMILQISIVCDFVVFPPTNLNSNNLVELKREVTSLIFRKGFITSCGYGLFVTILSMRGKMKSKNYLLPPRCAK